MRPECCDAAYHDFARMALRKIFGSISSGGESFGDAGCVARGEITDVSERYRRVDTDVPDSMESECSGAGI